MNDKQKCPECKKDVIGPFAHQSPDGKWNKRIACSDRKGCGWYKDIGSGRTAFEVNPVSFVK